MDIGMILIQVLDSTAVVVRCEGDGESTELVPAPNAVDLMDDAARAIAVWFNATLEQDGLYLCTNQLQAAAAFPPLALPADAITMRETGMLLAPDGSQQERWERISALQKADMVRIYRVGIGEKMKQYASRAAVVQFAAQQGG